MDAIAAQFGKIDVLINNAGASRGMTAEMSLEQAEAVWDHELATNLIGPCSLGPHEPTRSGPKRLLGALVRGQMFTAAYLQP